MKFVDEAKIWVRSGSGGKGCISFRREKFVPKGGPNGGDGGKGGDIVFLAHGGKYNLLDFIYKQHHFAENGRLGKGKNQHGRDGEDLVIEVPVGTTVKDAETGKILCDLSKNGERYVVFKGGKGGKGNAHFATSTDRAPRIAEPGQKGEEKRLWLELKLLADVGLIGLPNVGKSTLLSKISRANPRIAPYPFTTLAPNLGVVEYGDFKSYVVADIPGLIPGAHEGAGLGIRFLRHIERTSILIHMLDISAGNQKNFLHNFESINNELYHYDPSLLKKTQIIALNKIDLIASPRDLTSFKKHFKLYKVFPISSLTCEGLTALVEEVGRVLEKIKGEKFD